MTHFIKWITKKTDNITTDPATRHTKHVLIIILSTSVLIIIHVIFIKPYFLNIDDVFVNMVSAGIGFYQRPNEFNMYMHIWISQGIAFLYRTLPGWPHYGIMLIAVDLISITIILYVMTVNISVSRALMTLILLLIVVFHTWLAQLTYTQTAFLAGTASLSLAALWLHKGIGWKLLSLQFILLIVSLLIRAESFPLAFLCYSPFLAYLVVLSDQRRIAIARLLVFSVVIGSSYIFLKSSNDSYYANTSYAYGYKYWRNIYQPINDYGRVDPQHLDSLIASKYGLSRSDLTLFRTWFSADTALFNYDRMVGLISDHPKYRTGVSLKNVTGVVARRILRTDHIILLAFIGLNLILLSSGSRIVSLVSLIWSLGLCALFVFWLKLPERVSIPIFVAQVLISQTLIGLQTLKSDRKRYMIHAGLCLVLMLFCIIYYQNMYNSRKIRYQENQTLLSRLPMDTTILYIAWGPFLFDIAPLDDIQGLSNLRFVHIGPPFHMSYSQQRLEQFGIKDIGYAMNNSEHLYFAQTEGDRSVYKDYVKKRYGQDLRSKICFHNEFVSWYNILPDTLSGSPVQVGP